jgi:hypothetical protein
MNPFGVPVCSLASESKTPGVPSDMRSTIIRDANQRYEHCLIHSAYIPVPARSMMREMCAKQFQDTVKKVCWK